MRFVDGEQGSRRAGRKALFAAELTADYRAEFFSVARFFAHGFADPPRLASFGGSCPCSARRCHDCG